MPLYILSQNMREREGPTPNVVVKSSQSRGASKGIKYNRQKSKKRGSLGKPTKIDLSN